MGHAFKFLVVADESPEFPNALTYAAARAETTGSGLVLLCVVEPPMRVEWASVGAEMRAEAWEAAETLGRQLAAEVAAEAGVKAEVRIVEGALRDALNRALADDPEIRIIVLAASAAGEGPGPLVASLSKSHGLGGRPLPVVVVPGALTREEVRELAIPRPS